MPLPVLASASPPPPPAAQDTASVTWYAPDGTVWPLTDLARGWFTVDEVTGLGAAPILHTLDEFPRGGVRVRHTQPEQRYVTWPLYVEGVDHGEFLARWRALAGAFTQTRRLGPGILRIARPDGTAREITAYYEAGFAEHIGSDAHVATPVLTLLCEDPYWTTVTPQVVTRAFSTPLDFYSPFLSVSSGSVLGETTITNPGDVEAWPVWTITGPMTELTATNQTTVEAFMLSATLLSAEAATIDTYRSLVRGPSGEVWTGNLDWPGAVLWGLLPGVNDVEFQASGAAAGTKVELSWRSRHETA